MCGKEKKKMVEFSVLLLETEAEHIFMQFVTPRLGKKTLSSETNRINQPKRKTATLRVTTEKVRQT